MDKRVEAALAEDWAVKPHHTGNFEVFRGDLSYCVAESEEAAWSQVFHFRAILAAADAVGTGVVPEGYRLVPVEPTDKDDLEGQARYQAMIEAASGAWFAAKPSIVHGADVITEWQNKYCHTIAAHAAMLAAAPSTPLLSEEEIRADERERCAKIAAGYKPQHELNTSIGRQIGQNIANEIRAIREDKP